MWFSFYLLWELLDTSSVFGGVTARTLQGYPHLCHAILHLGILRSDSVQLFGGPGVVLLGILEGRTTKQNKLPITIALYESKGMYLLRFKLFFLQHWPLELCPWPKSSPYTGLSLCSEHHWISSFCQASVKRNKMIIRGLRLHYRICWKFHSIMYINPSSL